MSSSSKWFSVLIVGAVAVVAASCDETPAPMGPDIEPAATIPPPSAHLTTLEFSVGPLGAHTTKILQQTPAFWIIRSRGSRPITGDLGTGEYIFDSYLRLDLSTGSVRGHGTNTLMTEQGEWTGKSTFVGVAGLSTIDLRLQRPGAGLLIATCYGGAVLQCDGKVAGP